VSHVVFVSQNPIMPPDEGAAIRNLHLLRRLAQAHRVTVVMSYPPSEEGLRQLEELGLRVVVVPKPRWRHLAYLGAIARGVPLDFAVQRNPRVRRWLRRHAGEVDSVLVGSIGPAQDALPRRPGDPVVVIDTHNVERVRLERELRIADGFRERLSRRLAGLGTARFELRTLRAADQVLVCSPDEADDLRRFGLDHVVVVPNGVDLEGITQAPLLLGPPLMLFPGTLSYDPNDDAARWIASEIAPLVRAMRPDCRFLVAGRGAEPSLAAVLRAAGVELRSPVPDMRPVLHEATAVLAPLRSGSGTRLKILEAFAAGRPVVSTTLGAEGLDVEPGRHLLIADTAAETAAAIVRLIDEPELGPRLADAARTLVEQRYGWDAIGAQLRATLAGARTEAA
jgi:glycosyltransferase involved in cell wall biosynthesis